MSIEEATATVLRELIRKHREALIDGREAERERLLALLVGLEDAFPPSSSKA